MFLVIHQKLAVSTFIKNLSLLFTLSLLYGYKEQSLLKNLNTEQNFISIFFLSNSFLNYFIFFEYKNFTRLLVPQLPLWNADVYSLLVPQLLLPINQHVRLLVPQLLLWNANVCSSRCQLIISDVVRRIIPPRSVGLPG